MWCHLPVFIVNVDALLPQLPALQTPAYGAILFEIAKTILSEAAALPNKKNSLKKKFFKFNYIWYQILPKSIIRSQFASRNVFTQTETVKSVLK